MKVVMEYILEEVKGKPPEHFLTWEHKNLARFASESVTEMINQAMTIEQLRADLKDAMEMVRRLNA